MGLRTGIFPLTGILQPVPPNHIFSALIDSGASNTCISPAVAQLLRLNPISVVPVGSATHQSILRNAYIANVALILPVLNWWFPNLMLIEFSPQTNSPYQMLLGRDILCKGSFHMSPDGHFTLAI